MSTANAPASQKAPPPQWASLLELAAREVFEIMLSAKLRTIEKGPNHGFDFTSMVGFAGELRGVLTLCCSTACAEAIAAKMLGGHTAELEDQMWDALGEVTNMIAGNFKNKLSGMGARCMLSVPTVITGSSYHCHSMADAGSLEVRLSFERFPVQISLEVHS